MAKYPKVGSHFRNRVDEYLVAERVRLFLEKAAGVIKVEHMEKFNHQISVHRLKLAGLSNPNEVEASFQDPNRQSFPIYSEEILYWLAILED